MLSIKGRKVFLLMLFSKVLGIINKKRLIDFLELFYLSLLLFRPHLVTTFFGMIKGLSLGLKLLLNKLFIIGRAAFLSVQAIETLSVLFAHFALFQLH